MTRIFFAVIFISGMSWVSNALFSQRFYKTLDENEKYELIGIHPIPASSIDSDSLWKFLYDTENRLIKVEYYENGRRAFHPNTQFAYMSITYDKKKEVRKYYSPTGQPITSSEGVASVQITRKGNKTEIAYFDLESEPTDTRSLVSKVIELRTPTGQLMQREFRGLKGNLVNNQYGFAQEFWEYDKKGYKTHHSFLDHLGFPVINQAGVAKYEWEHDLLGNVMVERLCNENGVPRKYGHAIITFSYDRTGNKLSQSYFNRNMEPVLCESGVAQIQWLYEGRKPVLQTHLNPKGKLTNDINKTSSISTHYANGLTTKDKYQLRAGREFLYSSIKKDRTGKEVSSRVPYHRNLFLNTVWETNESGFLKTERIENRDKQLVQGPDGVAETQSVFDLDEHLLTKAYFDMSGNPVLNAQKVSVTKHDYKTNGQLVRTKFYGKNNQPVENHAGIAEIIYDWTEGNSLVTEAYFNLKGQPVNNHKGIAQIRKRTNSYGSVLEWACYDNKGKLLPAKIDESGMIQMSQETPGFVSLSKYNATGVKIEEKYMDEGNNPIIDEESIHKYLWRYNDKGLLQESAVFDAKGNPTLNSNRVFKEVRKYDRWGKLIENRMIGKSGQLLVDSQGNAIYRYAYNSQGLLAEEAVYDVHDLLKANELGIAVTRYTYDTAGNIIERSYLGEDKQLKGDLRGIAIVKMRYDLQNRLKENSFHGVNGNLRSNAYGIAVEQFKYDTEGNEIETRYYNERFDLVNDPAGVAIYRFTYDDQNIKRKETRLNAARKVIHERNIQ